MAGPCVEGSSCWRRRRPKAAGAHALRGGAFAAPRRPIVCDGEAGLRLLAEARETSPGCLS